ncbi:adenylyl-sulfate kinase [Pontibacter actiniarum]|uniref:Adenylyl-sulfate kinase n=1 Tax=Pontibacter actiniarum TaxID=323450 RepID=A0A1X9YRH7_9BACT|nr:adenylyl-sulfate kinase [Pontibacter actiniarum]ARS35486.1 adenylyl-sulfate kinase [Pontibacter actiniarum]
MNNKKHIYPFHSQVCYEQRKSSMQQEPRLVWLTGLSGSGKSTLALRLEHYLFHQGYKVYLLDGDNIRSGLSKDLGFSEKDRKENVRRVAEAAKLMLDAGLVVLCAFISPYEAERQLVKEVIGKDRFTQVYVNCSLAECEKRDTKGLYAKARRGEIDHFTGISSPYEPPLAPDVEVATDTESIEESLGKLIAAIEPQLSLQNEASAVANIVS